MFAATILFLSIIMYSPVNSYKLVKSKEDQLILQKLFLFIFCFSIEVAVSLLNAIGVTQDFQGYVFQVQQYIFNIIVVLIFLYNFYICIEMHLIYSCPIHYFVTLFKQKSANYLYEFFAFIIAGGIFAFNYFISKK